MLYLKGTVSIGLVYDGHITIVGFVDFEFASDLDKRRSLITHLFQVGCGVVSLKEN